MLARRSSEAWREAPDISDLMLLASRLSAATAWELSPLIGMLNATSTI